MATASRSIIAACSSSTFWSSSEVVRSMILTSALSWRIITAGIPVDAWRTFSKARWTRRSHVVSVVMTRTSPATSR